LRHFSDYWDGRGTNADATLAPLGKETVVAPGQTSLLATVQGPAVLRQLQIDIKGDKQEALPVDWGVARDLLLRIYWDDSRRPSVDVPLGTLFGDMWCTPAFQSRFFGFSNGTFSCRFPMPFKGAARFEAVNSGTNSVVISTSGVLQSLAEWDRRMGYFHAVWRRSGPNDLGRAHQIVGAAGCGKYVGCVLAVMSLDRNWWLLEGNESIRRDGEAVPRWLGTGLEDYFNAGWYYRNNFVRPLHGLLYKVPFHTVQYRVHTDDAPTFRTAIEVQFERGPGQASHAWMESVGFYYLAEPASASSSPLTPENRERPVDPMSQVTIMTDLCNYERFGDYLGAKAFIDDYLRKNPDCPFAAILRLRQMAYVERTQGSEVAIPLYRRLLEVEQSPEARKFAELLLWFHEVPSHALLSVYCGNKTSVFLDRHEVGEVNNPQLFAVFPVTVSPGKHVLGLEATQRGQADWVQACLHTHQGNVMTEQDWQFSFSPDRAWREPEFDSHSWATTGDAVMEGPPVLPVYWTSPHPFVDMQAKPLAIWVSSDWPANESVAVFRKEFEVR